MSFPLKCAANVTKTLDNTTPVEILASNSKRRYAAITNATAVGLWLAFGENAAIGKGVYVAPGGGFFEIDETNLWTGSVKGIMSSGSNHVISAVELS